jgi:ClpP class serine protease
MHADRSAEMERRGVKVTYISSVPGKVDGNEFEPLSETALADMRQAVKESGDAFEKAVAAGRGVSLKTVRSDFGGGRLLSAQRAKQVGMIDRIGTMGDTLARANGGSRRRADEIHTVRDFEDHLREAGFSANAAKAISSGGFKPQDPSLDSRDETEWAEIGQAISGELHGIEARRILMTRR